MSLDEPQTHPENRTGCTCSGAEPLPPISTTAPPPSPDLHAHGLPPACPSLPSLPRLASNLTALIHRELERFGPYWKLQSEAASTGWNKHILAVKWEPIDDPATLG